jgi:hypothetical protein
MGAMHVLNALASTLPVDRPEASLVWQGAVLIGERQALRPSPLGERFIVQHPLVAAGHRPSGPSRSFVGPVRLGLVCSQHSAEHRRAARRTNAELTQAIDSHLSPAEKLTSEFCKSD